MHLTHVFELTCRALEYKDEEEELHCILGIKINQFTTIQTLIRMEVFLWMSVGAVCVLAHPTTSACPVIPENLNRPISDSLAYLNVLINATQNQVHEYREETIPTLVNMNRGLTQGGPIEELLTVGRYVYQRYLNEVDNQTNILIKEADFNLGAAVKEVRCQLIEMLDPCAVNETIRTVQSVIQRIGTEFNKLRLENVARYWKLYDEVSNMLRKLHATQCLSVDEFTEQLKVISDYGASTFDRYLKENGIKEAYIVHQFVDEIGLCIGRALEKKPPK